MHPHFDIQYNHLISNYKTTKNPEILEKLFQLTDQQVFDEKTTLNLKHIALQRLEALEKTAALSPLLKYRKAVLLHLMKKQDKALVLFRELIYSDETENYIKERCSGYLLKYYDAFIRVQEAMTMLEELRKTTDSTALHMLEEIEMSGLYNLSMDEVREENDRMEETVVFTSDDRVERVFTRKLSEMSFRSGHHPSDFDLYLDMIGEEMFIHGKKIDLSPKEAAALFTMAKLGGQCRIEDLYPAVFAERYEYNSQQKNRLQQFTSRFRREKLVPLLFSFRGTSLPRDTSFCLLYKRSYEDILFDYHD